MLKTVIVDDEPQAREAIRLIIKNYNMNLNVLAEAASVEKGWQVIREFHPDLVFLDILLPDGNGFDILSRFSPIDFKIIFITGNDNFAIQAIKYSALDYIMKPVRFEELNDAVSKARDQINKELLDLKISAMLSNMKDPGRKMEKIILKTFESIHLVNIHDIIRCVSDKNYTTFVLTGNKEMLVSKTIKEFDELLSPSGFIRIHQSYLINLAHFVRFDKQDGGYVVLTDNVRIPVSFRKKDNLFRALKGLC